MPNIIAYLLIGIAAGIVTGVIGASGVVITVPMLNFLGFSLHLAIGTSLAVDVIASLVVSFTYYKHGNVYLRQGVAMAIAAVVGAHISSRLAVMVPEVGLGGGFGLLLIVNGVLFWRRGLRGRKDLAELEPGKENTEGGSVTVDQTTSGLVPQLTAVALGLGIGVISGLFGAGGGVMVLMVLVFVLGYPLHLAIGTSTLIMAFTAASGALGYAWNQNLSLLAALVAGAGTIIGGRIAATLANKAAEKDLGKAAGLIFSVLGVIMLCLHH